MIWLVAALRLENALCSLLMAMREKSQALLSRKLPVKQEDLASRTLGLALLWQLPPDGQRDRVSSWDVGLLVSGRWRIALQSPWNRGKPDPFLVVFGLPVGPFQDVSLESLKKRARSSEKGKERESGVSLLSHRASSDR